MMGADHPQQAEAPKHPYIRPQERIELEADISACKGQLNEADPKFRVEDRNAVVARQRRLEKQLRDTSAPEVTPIERDALVKEQGQLTEYISDKMLSFDEMRKNPPGSVGANIKYHRDDLYINHHYNKCVRDDNN